MASGAQVQGAIKRALKRLNATTRVVKLRQVTRVGGNNRLGLGQDVDFTDTLCDPQPSVEYVSQSEIASSAGIFFVGDIRFTFAGDIPEATMKQSLIVYGTDVMKMVTCEPRPLFGVNAAWHVVGRTISGK